MTNVVFVKTMKNGRKHRMLNLYQKIKKEIILCQDQTIIRQNVFQRTY